MPLLLSYLDFSVFMKVGEKKIAKVWTVSKKLLAYCLFTVACAGNIFVFRTHLDSRTYGQALN